MKPKTKITNKDKFEGNPRVITKDQQRLLKEHLEELGDLSGVVYCQNQKAFVGGNQRSDIFNGADIEIVETFKQPTAKKTVALGFITYEGEKYAYREVKFTPEQFNKACIVANNDGGDFDYEILADWDKDELEEMGMQMMEVFGGDLEDFFKEGEQGEKKLKTCPHCGKEL